MPYCNAIKDILHVLNELPFDRGHKGTTKNVLHVYIINKKEIYKRLFWGNI